MNALYSTTLIAVSVIVAATVAACFHVIDAGAFASLVGGFGGGTGILHIGAAAAGKSSGSS